MQNNLEWNFSVKKLEKHFDKNRLQHFFIVFILLIANGGIYKRLLRII